MVSIPGVTVTVPHTATVASKLIVIIVVITWSTGFVASAGNDRDEWHMSAGQRVKGDRCQSKCDPAICVLSWQVAAAATRPYAVSNVATGGSVADSRVVSVLDSGTEAPGFKSQPQRCRVTVLGKLYTPIMPLFTK